MADVFFFSIESFFVYKTKKNLFSLKQRPKTIKRVQLKNKQKTLTFSLDAVTAGEAGVFLLFIIVVVPFVSIVVGDEVLEEFVLLLAVADFSFILLLLMPTTIPPPPFSWSSDVVAKDDDDVSGLPIDLLLPVGVVIV